jgi:16S rRNA (guanine527-N7)-methyltransferase
VDVFLLPAIFMAADKEAPGNMEIIKKYFSALPEDKLFQLAALKDLYMSWNEKINVISRRDIDNFYLHHVLHSLAIAARFDLSRNRQVMDLGCGGGFPGVPLAILFPGTSFTLVDSIDKKLTVIREIAGAIHLKNISTLHTRAEDIRDRKFDLVLSRAVAPLKDLWKWSKPLLEKNTRAGIPHGLICLKGGDLAQEIFESGCRPQSWPIQTIFQEDYFNEKYLLYVPCK